MMFSLQQKIWQQKNRYPKTGNRFGGKQHGFTLIELIVVMAVLAILVTMGMPYFGGQTEEAKMTRIIHDGKLIEDASYRFYIEEGYWPTGDPVDVGEIYEGSYVMNLEREFLTEEDLYGSFYDVDLVALEDHVKTIPPARYIIRNPIGEVMVIIEEGASEEETNPIEEGELAEPSEPTWTIDEENETVEAVIDPVPGAEEYRVNNREWQTGTEFDNLTPGAAHDFYARVDEIQSNATYTAPKLSSESPSSGDVWTNVTDDSISVNGDENLRVGLTESGSFYSTPVTFHNLNANTSYNIYGYYDSTDTHEASDVTYLLSLTTDSTSVTTVSVSSSSNGDTIEFSGRTWRMIDSSIGKMIETDTDVSKQWDEYQDNNYSTSTVDAWLNGEYLDSFSASDKSKIDNASWSGVSGSRQVVLLSRSTYLDTAGQGIYDNDFQYRWWLRTPSGSSDAYVVQQGSTHVERVHYGGGLHPVIRLSSDTELEQISGSRYRVH